LLSTSVSEAIVESIDLHAMAGTADTALLSIAITPRTDGDRERLLAGLQALKAEDSTLSAKTDRNTGEVVIAGTGELQLELVMHRLRHEFDVEASIGRPQIAYKEGVTVAAEGEMKYATQAAGRGHYAHVKIRLFPGEPGAGYVFENGIVPGTIPDEFVKPIDSGIKAALTLGILDGYPVDDVRVELADGSYHDVDSSATAFRIVAAMAFQDAARKAMPVVLEPVMHVQVVVPAEYRRDVMNNLASRRGHIESPEDRGDTGIVNARVPLAEMFGYATDLRSRTLGRATYSMRFDRYERCRRPDSDSGGRHSFVGAPRHPAPPIRPSRIELPEPDDDDGGLLPGFSR
jgi:elongation factor G